MFVTFDEHIGAGIGLLVFGFVGMIACAWPHFKVKGWLPKRLGLILIITLLVLSASVGTGVYRRYYSERATTSTSSTDTSGPVQPLTPLESVSVSPIKLVFKDQAIGKTSSAQIVTVVNRGTAPRIITGINVTGTFSQTNDCGSELMVGDSCNVEVKFTPTTLGLTHGNLEVSCIDPLFSSTTLRTTVAFSGSGKSSPVRKVPTAPPIKQNDSSAIGSSSAPVPTLSQECAPGAQCAQSSGQTGGFTGQINVDTPPLKLKWTSSPLSEEALPSISEGSPQKRFKYGQEVIVTPNVAFQPVSLAIICDQGIKEVEAYGAMFRSHFSLAAESNKIGLIYYEAPPLGPGVELTIHAFSDNPFKVVDVRPAKINQRKER